MSQIVTIESILVIAANFLFYFVIALSGAFTKDLYDNFINKKKKIETIRIFIAAFSTAFIAIGVQDYTENFSLNLIILFSFLCGVIGFELFGSISSIRNLRITILEIIQIKKFMDSGVSVEEIAKNISAQKTEHTKDNENEITETSIDNENTPDTNTMKDTSQDEEQQSILSRVISENKQ